MALTREQLQEALALLNVEAMLHVIRAGESSQKSDAYTLINGGAHFEAPPWRHPWHGIPTTKGAKTCGAYQFLGTTWAGLAERYGFTGFTPEEQDQGAVALIDEKGALEDVKAGRVEAACEKLKGVWVCFATMPQERMRRVFEEYGGRLSEEQPPAPVEERTISTEDSMPFSVMPFLIPAISSLIQHAPDLARIFGSSSAELGGRVEKNVKIAEEVAEIAKEVTSATTWEEAVRKLDSDPELSQKYSNAIRLDFDRLLGMTVKLNELQEGNIERARTNVQVLQSQERMPIIRFGKWLNLSFIEFLTLYVLVTTEAAGMWALRYADLSADLKGSIVSMMVVGGFVSVIGFWFGASIQSLRQQVTQLQQASARHDKGAV